MAPGCVLLQAVYGGQNHSRAYHLFDSNHWLVAPTKDITMIRATMKQWEQIAAATNKKWKGKRPHA